MDAAEGKQEERLGSDLAHLRELRKLLVGARRGTRSLSSRDVARLPRLYRFACSLVARLEASGESPRVAGEARLLIGRAHDLLYGSEKVRGPNAIVRLYTLFARDSPRAIREEWRLCTTSLVLVYGLALVAWFAVSADLDLASSLLDPAVVESEIQQLQSTPEGESFRGNFSFGLGESPVTAGWIMVHNMGVGVLFFASALVPPLYLWVLSSNGLMLGAYTGVAGHWGQAGSISSIIWCHGVLEIQALILAGTAGLCLIRAWLRPGPWSRAHALVLESRRALTLLAPVFPLLFVAGMIEGFVSPHAPLEVRLVVAVGTGLLLLAWVLLGGRAPRRAATG